MVSARRSTAGLALLVWHSHRGPRLCGFSFNSRLLLLIPSFPAVGNSWQEFSDTFYLFFRPSMQAGIAGLKNCGSRNFAYRDIAAERLNPYTKSFCCLTSRKHYDTSCHIGLLMSNPFC